MSRPDLRWLGLVKEIENACIVPPDEGAVIRHARPITAADIAIMREQDIARLERMRECS